MIKKYEKMCRQCGRMVVHTFTNKRRCRSCYARFVLTNGIKTVFRLHDQLGASRNLVTAQKATIKRLECQKLKLVARVQELLAEKEIEALPRPWYDSASLTPHASTNGRNH